nr:hypothetical protein [uncultured Arsenicibacter sp.]
MKKLGIIGLIVAMMLPLAETAEAALVSEQTTVFARPEQIFKKRKGYRKKKGFLWGLFRKNNCGCPKH